MRHVRSIFIGMLIAASGSAAVAAAPPTEPAPEPPSTTAAPVVIGPELPGIQEPPPIVTPITATAPLVSAPPGCNMPPAPVAVFVGTLADSDATTGRFAVQQIRAGSLDGYAVSTIVDVRFDDDIRFLHTGQQYLVGARPDPITNVLRSTVRLAVPLFGGDAVIGVNDSDVHCPRVEDGVKTLLVDGREVDTGVLAPLKTAKKSVAKAILKPLAVAFVVLVLLASIKLLVFAMVRAAREREPSRDELPPLLEVQRDRQHADRVDEEEEEGSETPQRV